MGDIDKTTELLVWLLDHRVISVGCRQVSTGEDTSDTEVIFVSDGDGTFTVKDWFGLPARSEYDNGPDIRFSPHHAGLFRVSDHRAEAIIKARDANEDLVKEKAELEARLKELNKELNLRGRKEAFIPLPEEPPVNFAITNPASCRRRPSL